MRILVNGVHLNVECAGHGSPLLLLHGFTGSTEVWKELSQGLGSNHRVIAVDLLGHGESDAPANPDRYSMDRTVDDLSALFDCLDLSSVILLGYSMGGRVALHLAIAQSHRLRSLMLESTSPGIEDEHERHERLKTDHELANRVQIEGIQSFLDCWQKLPLFASQERLPAETRERIRFQRLSSNPVGLANSMRGVGAASHPPLFDRLPTLIVPTLLIAGQLDEKYCQLARRMQNLIPDSTLVTVPNAGHAVHLEQPVAFQEAITTFPTTQNS